MLFGLQTYFGNIYLLTIFVFTGYLFGLAAGIKYVYIGNVPDLEAENTFCPKCHGIVIERKGFTIFQKNLEKGNCNKCGEKIPGVWA